jgi:hypothetical protein
VPHYLFVYVFENVRVAEIVLRQAFRVARDLLCYGRAADLKNSTDFFLDNRADLIRVLVNDFWIGGATDEACD